MNRTIKRIKKHLLLQMGMWICLFILAVAALGPWLIGDGGIGPNLENHLTPPSIGGRLGYGINGIDVLSWLIHGARMSLVISFSVTILSILLGITIGAIAGYMGGRWDSIILRITDIVLSFPGILLALYLAAVMPPSIFTLIFALSATGWVSYARLVRAQVLLVKNREYVTAAVAMGASSIRVTALHILPNLMGPVIVQASYGLSLIVLAEAGITFLGLGLPIGTPSWGALLDQGVANLFTRPSLAILPGLCIAISVLGFNLLGDGLRDILDPKSSLP